MNESIIEPTEYIFVRRLQDVCKIMGNYYSKATAQASTYVLRVHMQAFNHVMCQATESLLPFQANRLRITEKKNQELNRIESDHQRQQVQLQHLPTTTWVMDSNKLRREFLSLLRGLTQAQEDKLLRYVLSDIAAQLQLKHDQLLEKLNRKEHLFLAAQN